MGRQTTGLVLAAGGARGAYQAGVLAELLPVLAVDGTAPEVITGTSVGALNGVLLAATAHETPQRQVETLLEHWSATARSDVLRPLWRQLPAMAVRYSGEALGLPGFALQGLLDAAPLRRTLERRIDWRQLHTNLANGTLAAVGVTATEITTGRSITFVERPATEAPRTTRVRDHRDTRLGADHVMASAAIPALFPPAWIAEPADVAGWYVDGSTRLHTPLRPALDLGVDQLVAIGTTGIGRRSVRDGVGGTVDLGDSAVALLHAMVEDSWRRDLRWFGHVNRHLVGDGPEYAAVRRLRRAQDRPPYRRVPIIAITPDDPYEIGDLALRVLRERYRGWRGLRDPDIEIIHRLLGGESPSQGEVLSFVLFDEVFHTELVRLGRRDAQRWLRAHDGVWFDDVPW